MNIILFKMIYGIDKPIIIWASGSYYELVQRAIAHYNENIYSSVQFDVVLVEQYEFKERFTHLPPDDYPNIILVEDIFIQQYLSNFPDMFVNLENELDVSLFKSYKIPFLSDIEGHIVGCPCSSGTVALYYRKDIFKENGFELPDNISWEDFINYGQEIKYRDNYKYLLPPVETFSTYLMQSTGGLFYDVNCNLSSQYAEDVFELINQLSERELVPTSMSYDEIDNNIKSGNIIALIGAPYNFSRIKRLTLESGNYQEWDVINIPKNDILSNNVNVGDCSWMVVRHEADEPTENYAYIFDFLSRMFNTNDDISKGLYRSMANEYDMVPAINYMSNDLDELSNYEYFDKNVIKFLDSLDYDVPEIYYGEYTSDINYYFGQLSSKLSNGLFIIEEALMELENSISENFINDFNEQLDHISIISLPKKVQYYEKERFDPYGLVIRVYLTNGASFDTTIGYRPLLSLGDEFVTITYRYKGLSDSVNISITVSPRRLKSLIIETAREFYLQDTTLKNEDFKVYAVYNSGTKHKVENFVIKNPNLKIEKTYVVSISYGEDDITVTEKLEFNNIVRKLDHIEIIKKPFKHIYSQGEKIDLTGMSVNAYYSNEDTGIISLGSISCSKNYANYAPGETECNIVISYTSYGVTEETYFTIYKKVGIELEDANLTQNFGNAGFGTINLNTGNYHYYIDDFLNDNPTYSIMLLRSYNPDSNYQSHIGFGWRFNYQQELKKNSKEKWIYTLYDGKEYIFDDGYPTSNDRASIRNETLGLDLFIDDFNSEIILVDRNNNSMIFKLTANSYRLTKILNYPSKKNNVRDAYTLDIKYDNLGKIIKIEAGASLNGIRPTLDFIYEGDMLKYLEYLGTRVCEYSYSKDKLYSIKKINSNINNDYVEKVSFSYIANQFTIINHSKKDENNHFEELRYLIDSNSKKVTSFSYGYGDDNRDVTNISYYYYGDSTYESRAKTTVLLTNKNIVNVFILDEHQVISKYSYKVNDEKTYANLKPKMILSAESNGVNPLSIYDKYSNTLTLINDDFENKKDGWLNAIFDTTAYISGTRCIKVDNKDYLEKTFTDLFLQSDTTCFVSFWCMNVLKIIITITSSGNENTFYFIPNSNFNYWQYYAFNLGKLSSSSEVTIRLDGANSRLDDFKIIKAPYETPVIGEKIEYDEYGRTKIVREYSPIENKIYLINYSYDIYNQCRMIEKTLDNKQLAKTTYTLKNGLLTSCKQSNPNDKYIETKSSYENDICISSSLVNGEKINYSYLKDEVDTITIGESGSPNIIFKEKLYSNSSLLKNVEEDTHKNNYIYNEHCDISKVESGYDNINNSYSTKLDFKYDSYGNVNKVKIGNVDLITQNFDSKKKLSTLYANGTNLNYRYDNEDRLISVEENNNNLFSISYVDKTENAVTITHNNGMAYNVSQIWKESKTSQYTAQMPNYIGSLKVINYASNSFGNESTVEYYNPSPNIKKRVKTTYNKDGYIENITRTSNKTDSTSYQYDSTNYQYDSMNRLKSKVVKYTYNYNLDYKAFKKIYTYKDLDSNRTTTLIETETLTINDNQTNAYRYEYYVNGNISKVYKDGIIQKHYTYDSHNRLISEINYALNEKYTYEYDSSGNILSKKIYDIVDGKISDSKFKINSYDYKTITSNDGQNSSWGDQLKSYNGAPISYDACGNPTSYLGNNLTWSGRLLKSFNSTNMEYDYNGLRIKKGNRIYYWYNGNIVLECFKDNQNNEKYIYYHYDETGICGMFYDKQDYYFEKNILGDIIAIYDKMGILKCRYVYDSFGNHKIYDEKNNELLSVSLNIGNINPFRYRGYYFDKELNLYYLKTRYYDSRLGRFISPDSISYTNPESVMGYNLYAYCNDNPVMGVDPTGHFIISALIISTIIGVAIGAGASVISQGVTNGWGNINGWQVLLDGAIGGISGMLAATGIGTLAAACISGGLGFAGSVGGDLISSNGNWTSVNLGKAAIMGVVYFGLGAWAGAGSQNSSALGKGLLKNSEVNRTFSILYKATNNYAAGAISKRGFAGVFNLYGGQFINAVSKALPGTVAKLTAVNLTKMAISTAGSTVLDYNMNSWEWL